MTVYDKFEKEAFNITLNRNLNNNVITKAQYNEYLKQHEDSVIKFSDNGVGFYFDYHDADADTSGRIILSGGNYSSRSNRSLIVEVILFVINEKISCMECHGYGDYIDPAFFEDYFAL